MSKFFLGISLPETLETECEQWRRRFRAPKTIAHLTVIPPFTWASGLAALTGFLAKTLEQTVPISIEGEGLGSFGTRVIFVKVDSNPELLDLHKTLIQCLESRGIATEARPYHPHITLATRLNPQKFHRYWGELEGFAPQYSFICNALTLFQFQESRGWEKVANIPLGMSK